ETKKERKYVVFASNNIIQGNEMETLQLKNISYFYNKELPILQNINISFERGKMYAILGKSGSGKTTLLSLLAGLDEPVDGVILYEGNILKGKELDNYRAKHVSIIFQSYNLIDYLTAVENIEFITNKNARPILHELGILEEDMDRNVLQLSGGQQQRVAIGRALTSETDILLADEPTGNLDEKTAKEIAEILKNTAYRKKKCVIVVTHSSEVAKYADIVLNLEKGKLLEERRDT
ncbi:ABC transporter ATP-binding protein, partial [Blautia sp. DFI.6.71]